MNIIKITKKDCKSKQEVDVENYLRKKNEKREYQRNRYQIYLKKINKD